MPFEISRALTPTATVVLRALVYAVLITLLVLWAPGAEHTFIYQEF